MHISSWKKAMSCLHILLLMPLGSRAIEFLGCDGFSFIIIILFVVQEKNGPNGHWNWAVTGATAAFEKVEERWSRNINCRVRRKYLGPMVKWIHMAIDGKVILDYFIVLLFLKTVSSEFSKFMPTVPIYDMKNCAKFLLQTQSLHQKTVNMEYFSK